MGLVFAVFALAQGSGAYLMGAAFDATGSYASALILSCIVTLVSAVLMLRLGPYRYQFTTPSGFTGARRIYETDDYFAQAADSEAKAAVRPAIQSLTTSNPSVNPIEDQGRMAFAGKVSMLGVGAEVAARVTHRSDVRAGFNVMGYSRTFDKDGATYNGHLSMRTFETHYDFYPWARSFHISPGMLAFVGNPITAKAFLSQGQSFTLGGTDYTSDPANPVHVNGRLNFNQIAPMITVGFGNLVHRDSKRFTVPIELGVAFQGSPRTTLNLSGNVCDSQGLNCQSAFSSSVQKDVIAEQNKLNNDLKAFKVYPMISVGFGYKF